MPQPTPTPTPTPTPAAAVVPAVVPEGDPTQPQQTPTTKTFTHLPILPLSHAHDPATKPQFLRDLRDALLNVGFLYLSDTGLPPQLVQRVVDECKGFF
ncbi:hypothetical protein DM02DRAFT_616362, partial [Periconia macrospinosa]